MTSRFLNGSRYGRVARTAAGFQDSVGRKPGAHVEVVINIVPMAGRERKLRLADQDVPNALRRVRDMLRPKGRARRKQNRKGKGCVARRKIARLVTREQQSGMAKDSTLSQDTQALAQRQDPHRRIRVVMCRRKPMCTVR